MQFWVVNKTDFTAPRCIRIATCWNSILCYVNNMIHRYKSFYKWKQINSFFSSSLFLWLKSFDIFSTQRFNFKDFVKSFLFLQALLLTKRISTQFSLWKFPDQEVKGFMRTSGEIDFSRKMWNCHISVNALNVPFCLLIFSWCSVKKMANEFISVGPVFIYQLTKNIRCFKFL